MPESETWEGRCPFCPEQHPGFTVPASWPLEKFEDWLADNHFQLHVDEDPRAAGPTPACSRCQRYAKAMVADSDTLHRKCFEPDCYCGCSRRPIQKAQETAQ